VKLVADHISVESKPQACMEEQAEMDAQSIRLFNVGSREFLPSASRVITVEPLNPSQEVVIEIQEL
jgi:hypothetical protein